ncbi:hypothetical protein UlMin_045241 [Ulmus minor]
MAEELSVVKKNRTWSLVPYSNSMNVVGNKWVFRVKHNIDGQVIFVLIYVNDMIVTGINQVCLQVFIDKLHELFALKDLGSFHLFLGIEIVRDATGMYLTQSKYIEDLLEKTVMLNTKPCPTPAAVGKPLAALGGEPMKNQRLYKSVIGSLQYVTHTRPDLAFAINKLNQFL